MIQVGRAGFPNAKRGTPTPPQFDDLDPAVLRRQWDEALAALRDLSAQEALDSVRRVLTIHLCRTCYEEWIEDPAGNTDPNA